MKRNDETAHKLRSRAAEYIYQIILDGLADVFPQIDDLPEGPNHPAEWLRDWVDLAVNFDAIDKDTWRINCRYGPMSPFIGLIDDDDKWDEWEDK